MEMTGSVSSDKQDTHEDDKCKILLMSLIHVLLSVHVDNDIHTVTNNDDISTEDIINTPDIQQEITTN